MYFGGVNGFNVFEPKEFADNTYLPPVYVMDISFPNLNNEWEVRRLLQLDKPFYTVDKIRLPYKNNSLTIVLRHLAMKILLEIVMRIS